MPSAPPLPAGYALVSDLARLDVDSMWEMLSGQAYWGRWRTRADFDAQLASTWRTVGVLAPDGATIAFARAVSDGVDLAYLADVIVDRQHRGHGLGRAMVTEMIENGPGAGFRWLLHTSDAHGLYREFGFGDAGARVMERPSRRTAGTTTQDG